jgi:hypothetical protein
VGDRLLSADLVVANSRARSGNSVNKFSVTKTTYLNKEQSDPFNAVFDIKTGFVRIPRVTDTSNNTAYRATVKFNSANDVKVIGVSEITEK